MSNKCFHVAGRGKNKRSMDFVTISMGLKGTEIVIFANVKLNQLVKIAFSV